MREINTVGRVNGHPVSIVRADEGTTSETAAASLGALIDAGVDAIVGPASSRVALEILGRAVDAHVAVCSPTNTAIGLSAFPDDGLYVRTIPSDALQALAIAKVIEGTGVVAATVVAPDDDYGQAFTQHLQRALEARNVAITTVAYDSLNDDLHAIAATIAAAGTESVALIGSGDGGAGMLGALRKAGISSTSITVNDAMRAAISTAQGEDAAALLDGVSGVAPARAPRSDAFRAALTQSFPSVSTDYAAYAYDCVNLLALGAVASGSDRPASIVAELPALSTSGDECGSFADCVEQIRAERNVNFVGASGDIDLDANGDLVNAEFVTFAFDGAAPTDTGTVRVP